MNQLDEQQLRVHVPIVAWLMIVSNALCLLIGGLVFILLAGIGAATGDREAMGILSLVGTFVAGVLAVIGLPGIVAGLGLLARKPWGRIAGIVMSALGLVNVPIGTIIGVYALWVLLQESAGAYFAAGPAPEGASSAAA